MRLRLRSLDEARAVVLPRGRPALTCWADMQRGRMQAAQATPYGEGRAFPPLPANPTLLQAKAWLVHLGGGNHPLGEDDPVVPHDLKLAVERLPKLLLKDSHSVGDIWAASPRIAVLYAHQLPPSTEGLTAYVDAVRWGGVKLLLERCGFRVEP